MCRTAAAIRSRTAAALTTTAVIAIDFLCRDLSMKAPTMKEKRRGTEKRPSASPEIIGDPVILNVIQITIKEKADIPVLDTEKLAITIRKFVFFSYKSSLSI